MPTRVNGELLDENEVLEEERSILPRLAEAMRGESRSAVMARAREWARENVIDRVLLRQAASGDVEGLTARLAAKLMPPKTKDLTEYYRRNKDSLYLPEMVHAAHIVRNIDEKTTDEEARAAMETVAAMLNEGADFAEAADRHSDCPGRGGDLGFFARGQMVPEFDNAVFALAPGGVSGIFRTPFGYHIARLMQRRAEGVPKFEEVRERIAEILYAEKRQRAVDRFIDQLRAKASIENT
jgi:parvulin-like peptidyl-prolyl isomerase